MRNVGLIALGATMLAAVSGPALAAGDAEKGKAAFAKCGICHQIGEGAKPLIGPPLNNIIGAKAAAQADFTYSPGLKKLGDGGLTWTDENFDKWIHDPKAMVPIRPWRSRFKVFRTRASVPTSLLT